jgi:hypothetical protein
MGGATREFRTKGGNIDFTVLSSSTSDEVSVQAEDISEKK